MRLIKPRSNFKTEFLFKISSTLTDLRLVHASCVQMIQVIINSCVDSSTDDHMQHKFCDCVMRMRQSCMRHSIRALGLFLYTCMCVFANGSSL